MCSLLLTHPSAHTLGAVGTHTHTHTHLEQWTHTHTLGAVDTHTHTWSSGHTHTHTWSSGHTHTLGAVDTHTLGAVDTHTRLEQWTHTHLEQWTHTHTWSSGHTHLEQWTHTHTWSSGQPMLRRRGAVLGVWCLAQGCHLSRVQYLPEPRFEPITSGYKSDALSIRATTAPPIMQNNFNILQLVKIIKKHDKMMRDGMMHFLNWFWVKRWK